VDLIGQRTCGKAQRGTPGRFWLGLTGHGEK
jgi:hypothetical protein